MSTEQADPRESWLTRILWLALRAAWAMLSYRRQLDLPRWVRGRTFTALHGEIVTWFDRHLSTVESQAPWLDRAGVDIWDYCMGTVQSAIRFSLESGVHATATCVRDVIAVYGFDGELTQQLGRLADALSVAGWTRSGRRGVRDRSDSPGDAVLRWQPSTELGCPAGWSGVPPLDRPALAPAMWLSWISRGQTSGLQRNPARTQDNTRNYLAVESTGEEYWTLPEAVLRQHEHAVSVHLTLVYYSNPVPLGRRHRIPRYRWTTLLRR